MKKGLLVQIIIAIILIKTNAIDSNISEEFKLANSLYEKKEMKEALDKYLIILKNGYDNFEINYNIGCSYFKLKQYGEARYYFERALFYQPFDPDLFHNLSVVYRKVLKNPLSGEQIIMNKRIIFFLPTRLIIILLVIFIIITLFSLFLTYKTDNYKKISLVFLNISFVFTLFFTLTFFVQYNDFKKKIFVTKVKESNVYLNPNESETALTPIPEGTKGIIIEEINDYIRVKLNDGISGWIKKENIISCQD